MDMPFYLYAEDGDWKAAGNTIARHLTEVLGYPMYADHHHKDSHFLSFLPVGEEVRPIRRIKLYCKSTQLLGPGSTWKRSGCKAHRLYQLGPQ